MQQHTDTLNGKSAQQEKEFTDLHNKEHINKLIDSAISLKASPFAHSETGKHKTLAMLFFNSSLRTRMSTQKAAQNLGMNVMTINLNQDGWQLEFEDGTTMNADKAEHIKEAALVISQYADIIALRAFPKLVSREDDYQETILNAFVKYATVPVVNMESATAHPLQALADAMTIKEKQTHKKPKVVLTWAPHPKALPQAVPNSFVKMMRMQAVDLVVTHPEGYELSPEIMGDTKVIYDQEEALKDADFIYAKNWSSFTEYGKVLSQDENWMITPEKTGEAFFMHCLPVRRNVVVADAVLDSKQSLVIDQANNRTWSAQAVLLDLLHNNA
ncbi:N-acetylornithine carbamoyltransferase [Robertkochia sp. 1368]|nr:N-acetylornithine carbamoyltransferase [Robertkochia sediminum]